MTWMAITRIRTPRMRRENLALVIFGIIFLVHVNPAINASLLFYIRKSAAFLLGTGLVFLGQRVRPRSLGKVVLLATTVYAFFAVLQYMSEPTFWSIVSPLVPVRDTIREDRGAASLAPEATDFGFTAVYLFLFALLVRSSDIRDSKVTRLMPLAAGTAVACVFLSKSGSGVIALATVALTIFVVYTGSARRSLLWILLVGACLVAAATASNFLQNNRGVALLMLALSAPELLLHTTFSYRFVHNLIGVLAVMESKGLGFGAGSFLTVGPQLYAEYGLAGKLNLPAYYATAMERTLATNPSSVIAQLLVEYGILGVSVMLMLAHRVAKSTVRLKWACALMLFYTWAQSFPLAYPPFWLLLGLVGNPLFSTQSLVRQSDDKQRQYA
ncbi:MAG: hypothetical protein KF689_05315 [Gemmatimonadaceae bacterium]|nr:hypothetical protein [Gemmatimonadaceae bacterium]MCW5825407.1 hypothetical protein [Gemmatimonadaceae bacterium]